MVQTLFFSQLKIAIQDYYDQGVKKYTGNYGTQPIREENYIQPGATNQRDRVTSNRHIVSLSGHMIGSFVPLGTKLSTLIGCVQ